MLNLFSILIVVVPYVDFSFLDTLDHLCYKTMYRPFNCSNALQSYSMFMACANIDLLTVK